jgi:hypothetical protein
MRISWPVAGFFSVFFWACQCVCTVKAQELAVDAMNCQQIKDLVGNISEFSEKPLDLRDKVYVRYNHCLANFEKTITASDKPIDCSLVRELFDNPQRLSPQEQTVIFDEKLRCDKPDLLPKISACIADIEARFPSDVMKKGAGTRCCQQALIEQQDLMNAKMVEGKWSQCLSHYKAQRNDLGDVCRRLFALPGSSSGTNPIKLAEQAVALSSARTRQLEQSGGSVDSALSSCKNL